jgi:hypothetical protein
MTASTTRDAPDQTMMRVRSVSSGLILKLLSGRGHDGRVGAGRGAVGRIGADRLAITGGLG